MPVDPEVALRAAPREERLAWSSADVLLYHLALGAGSRPTDQRELRYVYEPSLHVLPTFPVVVPTLRATQAARVELPGVSVDLGRILHGTQRVEVHRPLPASGEVIAATRVTEVWDKGSAAVVVLETEARESAGKPLWTTQAGMFVRGEGGFGGERGPARRPVSPDTPPDAVLTTRTLPQQALWYRLLGDRNPLHVDPDAAAAAGFPAPILHGLATYGLVVKQVVDDLLDGAVNSVRSIAVRFAGVAYPGETLQTEVRRRGARLALLTTCPKRDNAVVLDDAEIVLAEE